MQVRLYKDTRRAYRNYADIYTLFFPYPKRLQLREGARAYIVGGNIRSDGSWNGMHSDLVPVGVLVNGNRLFLGRRQKIDKLPDKAREEIARLERLWNEAVTKDTDEAWERWNNS